MGACIPSRGETPHIIVLVPDQISRYPRQGKVIIKSKSPNGKTIGHSINLFQVTEPTKLNSRMLDCTQAKYWVSSCVLPGIDPRGQSIKVCQDNCLVLSNATSILLGLFDGHGSEGDKVSKFCCDFMRSFYASNSSLLSVFPI